MIKIKIKFLIFIVLIAIFAYLGGGNLHYSILYCGILILVLALIHIFFQAVTMKVNLNIDHNIFSTGDSFSFNIIVKSFGAFPASYILVKNQTIFNFKKNYNGDVTFLNYHKEKKFSNQLELKVRGVYDFSVTDVFFTDLFCIINVKKRFAQKKDIKVYPRIYRINEENFNARNILQNSSKNKSISQHSDEVRDLRLYREGDSLKKVHWKLSAKHNELYIKNFTEVATKNTNIILNMNKDEMMQDDYDLMEEQIVDLAVSLINYLQNKKFKIKLFINNEEEKIFSIVNHNEFQLLMEYFLNNKSEGKVDLSSFLNSQVTMLEQGSWLGIITLRVDEELNNAIISLINIGFKISVFYSMDNNSMFIKDQKSRGLEFIKCEEAIFSLNE